MYNNNAMDTHQAVEQVQTQQEQGAFWEHVSYTGGKLVSER